MGYKDEEKGGDKMCKENDEKRNGITVALTVDTTQAKKELNRIERQLDRILKKQKKISKFNSYNTEISKKILNDFN